MIGHDVPGLSPSTSIEIINEYPVTVGTTLIGYVYTTLGSGNGANGIAYFVPLSYAIGIGIISMSADSAFAPKCPNAVRNARQGAKHEGRMFHVELERLLSSGDIRMKYLIGPTALLLLCSCAAAAGASTQQVLPRAQYKAECPVPPSDGTYPSGA